MGERLLCKQEVIGSIPFTSTTHRVAKGERIRASVATRHEVFIRSIMESLYSGCGFVD